MTKLFRFFPLLGGTLLWLAGCNRTPAPPAEVPVSALRFPILLVWTGQSVQIKNAVDGLTSMHVNYVIHDRPQPVVIDSDLKIYNLNDLHTTKSGWSLMLNPSGSVPVVFKLVPHATQGLPAARKLITDCQWLGGYSDQVQAKKIAIADASTLEQMIAILQSEPPETEVTE